MSKPESHPCPLNLEQVPTIIEPHSVLSAGGLALVIFLLLHEAYCRHLCVAHIIKRAFAFPGFFIP